MSWDIDVTRKQFQNREREGIVEVIWSKEVIKVDHVSDFFKIIFELGFGGSEWHGFVERWVRIRRYSEQGMRGGRALLAFSLFVFLPLPYNLSFTESFFSLLSAGLGLLWFLVVVILKSVLSDLSNFIWSVYLNIVLIWMHIVLEYKDF